MTRLGWTILAFILLGGALFATMLRFGGPAVPRTNKPPPSESAVAPGLLAVPVAGIPRGAIRDSWGDPRGGGVRGHHGTDIMAPANTPVLAAAPGRIEKLWQSALGGTTLYVRSPDRRLTYYYAHLAGYAPGIREGLPVKAGDTLGFVGDTGDAGAGNYHLHFGLTRTRVDERWWQGEDINPYPLLAGTAPRR